MRRLAAMAVAVVAAATFGSTADSLAGLPPDPNLNDTVYGTVAGIRYASESRHFGQESPSYASATAGCGTSGKRLIGGGAAATGVGGWSWLQIARPTDWLDEDHQPDDGFFASGYGALQKTFRAYSICIGDTPLDYRAVTVATQPSSERNAGVVCLDPTWHAVSGGAGIASNNSWLSSSFPADGADSGTARDDGWRAIAHDTAHGGGDFRLYAICAKGGARRYVTVPPTTAVPYTFPSRKVSCGDDHVVGGGVMISGDPDQARIVISAPYDGPDADTIPDDGWRTKVLNAYGPPKQVSSFAICLTT